MRRSISLIAGMALVTGLLGLPAIAQAPSQFDTVDDARAALDAARQQQRNARARAEQLERQAANSREASDRAITDAAALAARVQQAEAAIAASEARLALANRARRSLDRKLSARRAPLVRLTGALQSMSRRPLALSALQPGSLRDLVYTRAVLDSTIPVIRTRTAALRGDLDQAKSLEAEARQAVADRRDSETALRQRRTQLVALAEQERMKARQATGGADREAQRALVLAEQAIDLDQLVGRLEAAGSLRQQLAALPGPLPRPADPARAMASADAPPRASATNPPAQYQLPVAGEIVAGFGEAGTSGQRQAGIALAARPRALVVAPGPGRVAFAGSYRGFGRIVILEHANGWTSLVTGLGTLDVAVGQDIAAGSPLGLAPAQRGEVTLELRKGGEPVNPLDHLA
ncbi:murein hydrolase activator EnvC family protein [Qipengyuania qiaonensis]|uniref:Peptidoglycan DD-metalloendopeptidase family protein n=1 Tax=Qipengyuania qiaonensis TaxID=2867240 RepID=A0ABS7J4M3_9SPHN|nr:peptidoglycan DD-metalloendopeptidase family protein [Qipengyuania qiaonensis]MBX7482291.1 peptidoglycan DD-metalloendopeptidase family protein [Qipengyuania qiaonensis]